MSGRFAPDNGASLGAVSAHAGHDPSRGTMPIRHRPQRCQRLARKLLIALWRLVHEGVVPEGVVMRPA